MLAMEKLFVNALNNTLADGATINNTNLVEGNIIGEAALNTQIAQAIRTLKDVDAFGKGTVSVVISYIPTEFDGYVFQKDDTIIFLEYVAKSREIERVIINKEEGEYPSYYLLQALILLEMLTDMSSLNLKQTITDFVHLPFIEKETEHANEFATLVVNIESLISAGTYEPFDETEVQEDLSLFSSSDLLEKIGISGEIPLTEKVNPVAEEAIEIISDELAEQKEEVAIISSEETRETLQQISLFDSSEELTVAPTTLTRPTTNKLTTAGDVYALVENALVNGHTVDEIAKGASVAPSTIYGLKEGVKTPRQSTLDKIVQAVQNLENTAEQSQQPILSSADTNVQTNELIEITSNTGGTNMSTEIVSNTGEAIISEEGTTKFLDTLSKILESRLLGGQPVAEPIVAEQPVFNLDHAKTIRPLFFEDMWVRAKLKEFDLDDTTINDVLAFRKEKRTEILQDSPELVEDVESAFGYTGFTEPVETAIDVILEDLNLLLKGEAGSGKTTLIQSISCLFNLPLYTINGSDESNIETIVGFKEIEKGRITFKAGRLVKAMQVGGIFYSDEANMIRPNILAIINGALDHRRELYNEFVGERIKGHKDFRFMAAINENYEDTREMNRATLDRSVALEMSYMTVEQLKNLLRKTDPDTSEVNIRTLALISTALQDAAHEGTISPEVASVRNILFIQRMIRRRSFETAIARIVDKYPKEDRPAILGALSIVDKLTISAKKIIAV